jgi:hypothetical protein
MHDDRAILFLYWEEFVASALAQCFGGFVGLVLVLRLGRERDRRDNGYAGFDAGLTQGGK